MKPRRQTRAEKAMGVRDVRKEKLSMLRRDAKRRKEQIDVEKCR